LHLSRFFAVLFFFQDGKMGKGAKTGYLTDVSDEEWAFVLPYLLLSCVDNASREHDLRAIFNAVRYVVKGGNQWRLMPNDLPPWPAAVCIDSRTLQSIPESGARAAYDGAKRRKGSKVHIAVDTLGHLIALTVTPADAGNRTQVAALAQQMQQVTGNTVELAYVDQGYTGPNAAEAAEQHGIRLEVVKHPMAKRGFVLLPRRWVVERSFAWAARFRRLARDYKRLDTTLKSFHYLCFASIMLSKRPVNTVCSS
jgi:transposase